jgi:hypothetical protein
MPVWLSEGQVDVSTRSASSTRAGWTTNWKLTPRARPAAVPRHQIKAGGRRSLTPVLGFGSATRSQHLRRLDRSRGASPSHIGALLLGYFAEDGRLRCAGRASTGMTANELNARWSGWRRCRCRVPPAPAAGEEAAFAAVLGKAFRSGRAEHRKQ